MEPLPCQERGTFLARLEQLVATLRGPGGCPWDIKQTPLSLKKYLLEECQELADAIDSDDERVICEEMGDVYFILAMLAAMFADQKRFTTEDAIEGIIAKMIRRHPHVFGGTPVTDEQELQEQWRCIKEQEKLPARGPHP